MSRAETKLAAKRASTSESLRTWLTIETRNAEARGYGDLKVAANKVDDKIWKKLLTLERDRSSRLSDAPSLLPLARILHRALQGPNLYSRLGAKKAAAHVLNVEQSANRLLRALSALSGNSKRDHFEWRDAMRDPAWQAASALEERIRPSLRRDQSSDLLKRPLGNEASHVDARSWRLGARAALGSRESLVMLIEGSKAWLAEARSKKLVTHTTNAAPREFLRSLTRAFQSRYGTSPNDLLLAFGLAYFPKYFADKSLADIAKLRFANYGAKNSNKKD